MKRVQELSVDLVEIDEVQPHPRNARLHTSAQLVAESLETHGQYKPIGVQRSTGYILHGNGTWAQLKAGGATHVWVTWLDVDDEQAMRILLVDNATSDESAYDEIALAVLLEQMGDDFTGTGFTADTAADIAALFSGAMTVEELTKDLGTEPDPAAFWPVARIPLPPDLYQWWIELVATHDGDAAAALRSVKP